MKRTLYSPLSELTLNEIRVICNFSVLFCSDVLGVNRRNKNPLSISICKDRRKTSIYYGEYCPKNNKIMLYRNNIRTVRDLLKVFIHEYTHYLQPIKTKYYKLLNEYGYVDHPFEIEANNNGDMYYKMLWSEYKKVLK